MKALQSTGTAVPSVVIPGSTPHTTTRYRARVCSSSVSLSIMSSTFGRTGFLVVAAAVDEEDDDDEEEEEEESTEEEDEEADDEDDAAEEEEADDDE